MPTVGPQSASRLPMRQEPQARIPLPGTRPCSAPNPSGSGLRCVGPGPSSTPGATRTTAPKNAPASLPAWDAAGRQYLAELPQHQPSVGQIALLRSCWPVLNSELHSMALVNIDAH